MNWSQVSFWPLLAGLGLFLFGMRLLENAVRSMAGRSFRKFLRKNTGTPLRAVLSGTLITALLQSSAMVSLLVMSFAGAGIIGLSGGIGMILGANLGTTFTGWLVSLIGLRMNIEQMVLPLIGIGGTCLLFTRSIEGNPGRLESFSRFLIGFSLMLLGISYMKGGFTKFASDLDLSFLHHGNKLLFLVTGFFIAAIIQSSSAAVMIFLASLSANVINLPEALFLVIGADLGTTMTALIGTIRANPVKRKVGWSQFIFNAISDSAALLFMPVYLLIISSIAGISDPLIVLVSFHSLMNLVGIVLVLPFIHPFSRFIDRIIRTGNDKVCRFIDSVHPIDCLAAIDALHQESHLFFSRSVGLLKGYFGIDNPHASRHIRDYNDLKNYENEIAAFYIKIQQQPLNAENAAALNDCIAEIRNAAVAVKEVKDVVHNIDELRNTSHDELFAFLGKLHEHQKRFYYEVLTEANRRGKELEEGMTRLHDMVRSYHQYGSEDVYTLFSKHRHHEILIPSMLNLIRAVNNSNESLLRAAGYNRSINHDHIE